MTRLFPFLGSAGARACSTLGSPSALGIKPATVVPVILAPLFFAGCFRSGNHPTVDLSDGAPIPLRDLDRSGNGDIRRSASRSRRLIFTVARLAMIRFAGIDSQHA